MIKLEVVNEHVLLEDIEGNRALLDTGSPQTWGDRGFRWSERLLPAQPGVHRMGDLSDRIGTPVHHLIGMDVLALTTIRLDWARGELAFVGSAADATPVLWVPTMHVLGPLPVVEAQVGEPARTIHASVDTGASVNFLESLAPAPTEVVGLHRDFHPTDLRWFESPVVERPWNVGGLRHTGPTAELPPDLAAALKAAGVDGILGLPFLTRQPLVLDLPRSRLGFEVR